MDLWIVCRSRRDRNPSWPECEGVFDSKEKAEALCIDDEYAVLPIRLNERLPDATDWPGAYWPRVDQKRAKAKRKRGENVIDYGADPTGRNDSSEAVQKAFDEARRKGTSVYFPGSGEKKP